MIPRWIGLIFHVSRRIAFACHAVIGGSFIGLGITTGNNMYNNREFLSANSLKVYYNSIQANIVLGIVVDALFILLTPFILLRSHGGPCRVLLNFLWISGGEYPYGALMGMSFISAFFMLLVGLSLQSADNITTVFPTNGWAGESIWGSSMTNTYRTTYAFAYILCGSYVVMTFLIWLCRDVFAPNVVKKVVKEAETAVAAGAAAGAVAAGAPAATGVTVVLNPVASAAPPASAAAAAASPAPSSPVPSSPAPSAPPADNPFGTPGPSQV